MSDKVLAVVNGVEIKEMDLQNALARVPANQRNYYASEAGKKQLLEQMISFELIYSDAKQKEEDKDEIFQKQLELIKKDALIQYSVQKILKDVKVEESEVKDYYETNKEQFKTPPTVTAKHILVDSEEEAKKIAEEIKNGLSFEDAAQKYSKCPSKAQGGSLGAFGKGQMVPEFEKVAFELEAGVISEPVKTQFGYHLIKVEDKKESSTKEFKEVEGYIRSTLLQQKQSNKYLAVVKELKGKNEVKINK
ncbi:peptidylprolyl isomerase [Haloimpatiens sp. FM7330]|uniref:peptidylprolyl isomerase n=1 Tax=Haloimpatiens sp. FM7330 TaxID=3298610 RepID=UPI003636C39A